MAHEATRRTTPEVVGILPAAGHAHRIAPLPCSKEVFPVGFDPAAGHPEARPKVAAHYLLEKMRRAGARKAFLVLRNGKWDIPAYFGDGHRLQMHLAYLMMRSPRGTPFTLDQAYPFVHEARVLLGFPDILFQPDDAFARLLQQQEDTGADIALGLFPAHKPHKMDMVDVDEAGRIRAIVIKPAQTSLRYTWIIAAWTPVFTQYLHDYIARQEAAQTETEREFFVGDVIQAALEDGLRPASVFFPEGSYIDIGTPEDLARAVRDALHETA